MEKQQQKDQWLRARLGTLIGFFAAFLRVVKVVVVGPIFETLFLSIVWFVTTYAVPLPLQKTYEKWTEDNKSLVPKIKLVAYHAQWIMGCATLIAALLISPIFLQEHSLYGEQPFVLVRGIASVWGLCMFSSGLFYWFNESEKHSSQ